MATMVKVREVARNLSVSPGTVSKILRGASGCVSIETAHRVLQYCKNQGYLSANAAGQILSKMKSQSAGQQIFTITSRRGIHAYDAVFAGICRQMQEGGLYASCYVIHNNDELKKFPYDKAEGVIIIGRISSEIVREFCSRDIPVVLVDNRIPNLNLSTVNSNNLESVGNSVRILAEKGHKRIAFAMLQQGKDQLEYTFQQRQLGYFAGLQNAGLPINQDLLIVEHSSNHIEEDFNPSLIEDDLRRLAAQILEISPIPTAVIAGNDLMAYYIRKELSRKGIRVPEDISIIGYDGWHRHATVSNVGFLPTSTMAVDWEEMGRQSIDLMMELQIENGSKCRHIEVPTEYDDLGTVVSPQFCLSE